MITVPLAGSRSRFTLLVPDMVSSSQLLTVRQVAARLCLSASAVYQLIESRQLAHHRLGSHKGAIRVSEADLMAYLATCREEQAQQKQQERRPKRTTLKHLRLN